MRLSRSWKMGSLALALVSTGVAVEASVEGDEPVVVLERVDLQWSATGRQLGWLAPGARIERLTSREGWTRARVRGWMKAAELDPSGNKYEVVPKEAELRSGRAGDTFGALVRGVKVSRVDGDDEWYEIEMIGWLPDRLVGEPTPDVPAAKPAEARPRAKPVAPAVAMGRLARAAGMRRVPEGPALVSLPEGMVVRTLETKGGWLRVEIEGWVPTAAVASGAEGDVDPEMVARAPADAFAGREVAWTVEHVAVQRADRWRTDFRSGETFELARVPGIEGRYVYLVLPERLVPRFRELAPFERVRIAGAIRTGRSPLTGNPIVEVARVLP